MIKPHKRRPYIPGLKCRGFTAQFGKDRDTPSNQSPRTVSFAPGTPFLATWAGGHVYVGPFPNCREGGFGKWRLGCGAALGPSD
jgi:hypothetical protein